MTASEGFTQFPDNFFLGVASGAYQIEGGWNADGKSPSIWDHYFHRKNQNQTSVDKEVKSYKEDPTGFSIFDDGDIACDSYNKLDEDIRNLVGLGVNVYRFSISWPRVLPKGDDRFPNERGIKYYKDLIQKLLDNNIQPVVTMYHWDLPAFLQQIGGWANPNIIEYFTHYATFLFETYGDQVKFWTTINEPRFVAEAYGTSEKFAPALGEKFSGIGDYMVVRNTLLAHAAVYKIYKNSFKATQQGEISICLDTTAFLPEIPELEEHIKVVSKSYDFFMGIFVQPLVCGEFPKSVVDAINETNRRENVKLKRIIEFTEEEKKDLIGSYDFIAFNYYWSCLVRPLTEDEYNKSTLLKTKDMGISYIPDPQNLNNSIKGFSEVIDWLVKTANNPKLFVTENGFAEKPDEDQSEIKIQYHNGILTELDRALKKGVDIKGYCVWSFMDSLEWSFGYFQDVYGIYSVDFKNSDRPRTKKLSFKYFENVFKSKTFPSITQ